MLISKRIIGIAAAAALAAGMATTDLASAGTINGTQIEYVENSDVATVTADEAAMRQLAVFVILSHT